MRKKRLLSMSRALRSWWRRKKTKVIKRLVNQIENKQVLWVKVELSHHFCCRGFVRLKEEITLEIHKTRAPERLRQSGSLLTPLLYPQLEGLPIDPASLRSSFACFFSFFTFFFAFYISMQHLPLLLYVSRVTHFLNCHCIFGSMLIFALCLNTRHFMS